SKEFDEQNHIPVNNPVDEHFIEQMQQRQKISDLFARLSTMEPEKRVAFLKKHGIHEKDIAALYGQQAQQVEGQKETGVESKSFFESPETYVSLLATGYAIIPILSSV